MVSYEVLCERIRWCKKVLEPIFLKWYRWTRLIRSVFYFDTFFELRKVTNTKFILYQTRILRHHLQKHFFVVYM